MSKQPNSSVVIALSVIAAALILGVAVIAGIAINNKMQTDRQTTLTAQKEASKKAAATKESEQSDIKRQLASAEKTRCLDAAKQAHDDYLKANAISTREGANGTEYQLSAANSKVAQDTYTKAQNDCETNFTTQLE